MLKKLFAKNPATYEAHPLKVNFAHHTIPALLKKSKSAFLSVLISEQGDAYLRKTWQQVGEKAMGRKKTPEPKGLEVSVFKDQGYFFTFFHFPEPEQDGEPYFGIAVFYPPEGGEWNTTSVEAAEYSYFTAIAFQKKTRVKITSLQTHLLVTRKPPLGQTSQS